MRAERWVVVAALVASTVVLRTPAGEAHKPITSPYTFNEDIFPLMRDRCGRCHVSGGVAPMSLMTHADAVPWGESIKTELLAGQMPPWSVDRSSGRFRNVEGLTAREMNLLLTWVTGGTPLGDPDKAPPAMTVDTEWRLGPPDLAVQMPSPFSISADTREATAEFTIATGTREPRLVRAVDLRPGTPAIVRAASVWVKTAGQGAGPGGSDGLERLLALWLPGDSPVALDQGLGYELPAGAELVLRVLYRKTWEYERKEMSDRSTVGVYFASGASSPVERVGLTAALPDPASGAAATRGVVLGRTVDRDVRALAIYPESSPRQTAVTVIATRPDGSRVDLISFHPRTDWARRYWFAEPIALPRGTRVDVTATIEDEMPLLPLSAKPATESHAEPSSVQLVLNVVPGR
jgi:hypothetical protein